MATVAVIVVVPPSEMAAGMAEHESVIAGLAAGTPFDLINAVLQPRMSAHSEAAKSEKQTQGP